MGLRIIWEVLLLMPWKPVKSHEKEVSLESIAVDEDVPIHFSASYPQITSSGMYV
jgi:hypothetical protein